MSFQYLPSLDKLRRGFSNLDNVYSGLKADFNDFSKEAETFLSFLSDFENNVSKPTSELTRVSLQNFVKERCTKYGMELNVAYDALIWAIGRTDFFSYTVTSPGDVRLRLSTEIKALKMKKYEIESTFHSFLNLLNEVKKH